jgi:hypothetical protein
MNLESVHLDVDENISKEKFLKLNDIEVQSPETTETDLWSDLKTFGFNYALELDMVCVEKFFFITFFFFDRCVHSL